MKTTFFNSIRALFCLASLAAVSAHADRLDDLVCKLKSDDNAARVEARQLLPREDLARTVEKLVPLLDDPRAEVWYAAKRVIEDCINHAGLAGREAKRAAIAASLMTLVTPEKNAHLKEEGLRLLPRAIPEGFDVAPVAALLTDADFREKARRCLEETKTTQAEEALCAALDVADATFKKALLHSLTQMRAACVLPKAEALVTDENPGVRAAAARALAWTGDPKYVPAVRKVCDTADDVSLFDAYDALLRFGDAIANAGGNWDTAMGLYRGILADPRAGLVQLSGAMCGLGRYGMPEMADDILNALKRANSEDLEPAAAIALGQMRGANAAKVLVEKFPLMSESMQLNMLRIFGQKKDAAYLPLLAKALEIGSPEFKHTAALALAESELPGAAKPLAAYAETAQGDERAAMLEGLKKIAAVLRLQNDRENAGAAFLAIYRLAPDDATKANALEGIKQFPTADAFEVIQASSTPEAIAALPVGVLAGVALSLLDAKRNDEADKLMAMLATRLNTTEAVQEIVKYLAGRPEAASILRNLGVVRDFKVAGPFPFNSKNGFEATPAGEPNVDLTATYPLKDGGVAAWKRIHTSDMLGMMALLGGETMYANVCAFVYTTIAVPEACDAQVRMGSDDGNRVWVNGEQIGEDNVDRGAALDQDSYPAHLKAGENAILAQITQIGGGWCFCMRLTKADGTPLEFTLGPLN